VFNAVVVGDFVGDLMPRARRRPIRRRLPCSDVVDIARGNFRGLRVPASGLALPGSRSMRAASMWRSNSMTAGAVAAVARILADEKISSSIFQRGKQEKDARAPPHPSS
jgi:hypothetical protein